MQHSMSAADRDTVLRAVKQGSILEMTVPMQGGSEQKPYSIVISVEPIRRPEGFSLVRGREQA